MAGEIDWAPVVMSLAATNWTAVLVALISGLVALVGPVRLWKKQMVKESESVKASLFAEVAALIEIVERRQFLPGLREKEEILTARKTSAPQIFPSDAGNVSFQVLIDSQYSRVYQGNVSRLGVLTAEEATQIVRFHQLADSVRLDVIPGGVLAKGTSNPEAFRETADLLETALDIGRALVGPKPKRK